jgi:hypothetical protein
MRALKGAAKRQEMDKYEHNGVFSLLRYYSDEDVKQKEAFTLYSRRRRLSPSRPFRPTRPTLPTGARA